MIQSVTYNCYTKLQQHDKFHQHLHMVVLLKLNVIYILTLYNTVYTVAHHAHALSGCNQYKGAGTAKLFPPLLCKSVQDSNTFKTKGFSVTSPGNWKEPACLQGHWHTPPPATIQLQPPEIKK